jgi:hypothetical protein
LATPGSRVSEHEHAPQSEAQLAQVSLPLQLLSPQNSQGPQSWAQVAQFSSPLQLLSPQNIPGDGEGGEPTAQHEPV